MAADSRGERNRPIYAGTGASADAEDLTYLGERIADLGTRRVGTKDDRDALPSEELWPGLQFYDVGTGITSTRRSDGSWYRGGGGHFEGQRTQTGIPAGNTVGLGAVTRDGAYSSGDDFLVVGGGGTIALSEGRYSFLAMMTMAATATSRSFVSIDDNDSGVPIARAYLGPGEDRASAAAPALRALSGGRNIRINFVQNTGAARDVTIRLTIDRLG